MSCDGVNELTSKLMSVKLEYSLTNKITKKSILIKCVYWFIVLTFKYWLCSIIHKYGRYLEKNI